MSGKWALKCCRGSNGGSYLETEGKDLYAEACHEGRSIKM